MSRPLKSGFGQRHPNSDCGSARSTKRTREATVYDAVAGELDHRLADRSNTRLTA